jgi:hypothetical protein
MFLVKLFAPAGCSGGPDGLRHPESVDIRRKTFVAEATRRLGFLVQEHGFAGPEIMQDGNWLTGHA